MTEKPAFRRAWACGVGLVLLLAPDPDTCFGQIWRIKKPKGAVEKAQRKRRATELVRESKDWAVRFIRFRIRQGAPAATKADGTSKKAAAASTTLELDIQIRKKSAKVEPWFLAEWVVIARKGQSKGKQQKAKPLAVKPARVTKHDGESLPARFEVKRVDRVTLAFPMPVAPVSAMEARFLDLKPVSLSTIQKFAKRKR